MMTTKTLSPHAFQEETFTASMETPQALASPIIIDGGKVVLQSQVVLAPMAGVTDIVFRGLVRKTAPQSLICTEMISSNSLVYSKRWDAHILKKTSEDNPIAPIKKKLLRQRRLLSAKNISPTRWILTWVAP